MSNMTCVKMLLFGYLLIFGRSPICDGVYVNLTNFQEQRQTRSLLFNGGGIIKLVVGGVYPIYLEDPIKWRQLNCAYNIHGGQYLVPNTPIYPLSKWEELYARTLKSARDEFDRTGYYVPDETRLLVYTALENYMNKNDVNGHQCLLRSICENAQTDDLTGIFIEVLSIILTPDKKEKDDDYWDAFVAGKSGVDCLLYYSKCLQGESFLDRISVIA